MKSCITLSIKRQAIGLDEARGLLNVITDYAYALTTLDRFDHGTLVIEEVTRPAPFIMTYEAAIEIVEAMQPGFGGLFGLEKDQGFKSALGAVYQTFGGEELYPRASRKRPPICFTLWSRTTPSATAISALPPPCSLPFWRATKRFTEKMERSGLPIMLWWLSR